MSWATLRSVVIPRASSSMLRGVRGARIGSEAGGRRRARKDRRPGGSAPSGAAGAASGTPGAATGAGGSADAPTLPAARKRSPAVTPSVMQPTPTTSAVMSLRSAAARNPVKPARPPSPARPPPRFSPPRRRVLQGGSGTR
ncbi:MAG: hypothetical protein WKF31_10235 [Thermoleophilaceae bacterium]